MNDLIGEVVKHKKKWGYIIWKEDSFSYTYDIVEQNNNFKTASNAKKKMKQRLCELKGEDFLEKHPQYKEMK